jgi:hypothetical protein
MFEFIQLLNEDPFGFATWFCPADGYPTPWHWLANMIFRGALTDDLHLILDGIMELGNIDMGRVAVLWPKGRRLISDPEANLHPRRTPGESQTFAFWLPHGLGSDYEIPEVCRRFHKDFTAIENVFFGYFKLPIRADLPPERLPCSFFGQRSYI